MKMRLDPTITPFSLEHTLRCGQSFRWEKHGNWWYGVVGRKIIKIKQTSGGLDFQTSPETKNRKFVTQYFRLNDDLPYIISQIDIDAHTRRAIRIFLGLRLLKQEPWESLISYICATYKNIPAIQKMIHNLCKRFGTQVTFDNCTFYTFPRPQDLAKASLEELRECGLGFRAPYISKASRIIADERFEFENLMNTSYEQARHELLLLPGVGPKVADCVLLFSLDKLEAFPVDVWMRRIVLEFYADHFGEQFVEKVLSKKTITPHEYNRIRLFGREYFGEFAGYAQEYLFAWARKRQKPCSRDNT